jgi:GAF domain-containing protein
VGSNVYDHPLFVETLSRFARTLLTPYDIDAVLEELTISLTGVLGLAGSGVVLASGSTLQIASAHPAHLVELEQIQQDLQAGPCAHAIHTGEVVTITDLGREPPDRWPDYAAVAVRLGMVAVAGIPLRLNDVTLGAFNMYDDRPREWSGEDVDAAALMGDMATGYLINASKLHQQEQLTQQLQHALDSRIIIEQAKGVLATAHGISVHEAFERIRRHARSHNATVAAACEAIVNLGMRI